VFSTEDVVVALNVQGSGHVSVCMSFLLAHGRPASILGAKPTCDGKPQRLRGHASYSVTTPASSALYCMLYKALLQKQEFGLGPLINKYCSPEKIWSRTRYRRK
jgi:hypothetical protein